MSRQDHEIVLRLQDVRCQLETLIQVRPCRAQFACDEQLPVAQFQRGLLTLALEQGQRILVRRVDIETTPVPQDQFREPQTTAVLAISIRHSARRTNSR